MNTAAMLADALREGVAYVPGIAFHPHGDRTNTLRLNFSAANPLQIEEGIRRLAAAAASQLLAAEPETLPLVGLPPALAPEAA